MHVGEEAVLRKLKNEFPDREWSVELVYRPMLLAETDGKAHFLYDFESRGLVTHLAPCRTVEIGHLLDCSDQEIQILAALRRMPRKLRSLSEITSWLAEHGHTEPRLVELVVRGFVGPSYRITSTLSTAPAVSTKLTTPPLPSDTGQVLVMAEALLVGAIQELRRVLALLWGQSLGSAHPVGLPICVASGPRGGGRLSVGRNWPWQCHLQDLMLPD